MRVERILEKPIQAAYATKQENIVKAVFADGNYTYVDLLNKKEVQSTELKIDLEDWSKVDTAKLLGEVVPSKGEPVGILNSQTTGNFSSAIAREDTLPTEKEEAPKKTVKRKTANTKKKK